MKYRPQDHHNSLLNLYIMQALVRGFSVFYFVLLPVFYAQKLITSSQLGYVGALYILALIVGAAIVAHRLHNLSTHHLLRLSACITIVASIILLVGSLQKNLLIITISFIIMGLAIGLGMSGVNAVAANVTNRGNRYRTLAHLGMVIDTVRIVFPLLVAGMVAIGAPNAAVVIIIGAALLFFVLSGRMPNLAQQPDHQKTERLGSIWANKPFRYVLSLEFLDSFSSSQLFVFLPLLFLTKGYSLESSLLLQSCVFLGYFSGRWLVGRMASRYSGIQAIAIAEAGMVFSILLLLVAHQLWLLYILSFALGVFARGTSPVIKALSFDSLQEEHMKKGSALHVIAGDSGSSLGQLMFGLLVAWYGVNTPFFVAAAVAALIVFACFTKFIRTLFDTLNEQLVK